MPKVTAHLSISLDGFVAGPNQTPEQPLGVRRHGPAPLAHRRARQRRGPRHDRAHPGAARRLRHGPQHVRPRPRRVGDAGGRCGAAGGARTRRTTAPVFVLTHYPADPIEMEGGTTFHFVTSFDEAMERAIEAAGDDTVTIAGGASAVRQGFEAGVIDEIMLSHAPVVLGGGESPFAGLDDLRLRPIEVHASPHATHVVYSTRRASSG